MFRFDVSSDGLLLKKTEDDKRITTYHYEQEIGKDDMVHPSFTSIIGPTGIITTANKR